ncbi:MAG: nucleotide exchange factor GrpE [Deltaproteobacteria bacterium]|nr:nucleotide exchange factor GrpE [Deltaproteobacteria bacterium]
MGHKKINVRDEHEEQGELEGLELPSVDEGTNEEKQLEPEREASIIEEELKKLRAEAEANYDKYLRSVAELENYKKRAIRERSDLLKYAGENLARDILEVVDQLDIALKHEATGSIEEFVRGFEMVRDNLLNILERHQVKSEASLGVPFDPQKHEAMASVPSADYDEGMVMEVFRKPYFFKDKLLRPGQVVVAKKMENSEND